MANGVPGIVGKLKLYSRPSVNMHISSYDNRIKNLHQQSQRPQRKARRVVDETQRADNVASATPTLLCNVGIGTTPAAPENSVIAPHSVVVDAVPTQA